MSIRETPRPFDVGPLPDPARRGGVDLFLAGQEETKWCWAACVEMVLNRLKPVPAESAQCQIARKGLVLAGVIDNEVLCCTSTGNNPACDELLDDESITALWVTYQFPDVKADHGNFSLNAQGTIDRLVEALNNGNPVELGFSDNFGHVVMLYRWELDEDGTRRFFYLNPGPGAGAMVSIPSHRLIRFQSRLLNATWEIPMPN
jgi:hypothetical protein